MRRRVELDASWSPVVSDWIVAAVIVPPEVTKDGTATLRIEAGGRTLAYSADTAFDPSLIDWLAEGSDLVVHETNLGVHTPYEELAALPAELRAKMRLIHYPDAFDRDASVIEPLEQGRVYPV